MRFNPDARIDTGRVEDTGSFGGTRLPIPTTAGGGKLGLLLLVLGFVLKILQSRRRTARSAG